MTEKFEIENEDIFEPEKPKEESFEKLLEDVPAPFANYLKAAKQMMEPLTSAGALSSFRPVSPFEYPRLYKALVIRLDDGRTDHDIEKQFEDMMNAGYILGDRIPINASVICLFWRQAPSRQEDSNND